jgi:uncharacterized protein (DUF983 family)
MSMTTRTPGVAPAATASRPAWQAVKRGLRGRCPSCGEGRILHHYIKVVDACPSCGEEMHHHRADDFPAYVTILLVGHVLVAAMFAVDEFWPDLPLAFHFAVWPALVVLMSLWLLPIVKGALVAYQWALRMHGFETAHQPLPAARDRTAEADARRDAA